MPDPLITLALIDLGFLLGLALGAYMAVRIVVRPLRQPPRDVRVRLTLDDRGFSEGMARAAAATATFGAALDRRNRRAD